MDRKSKTIITGWVGVFSSLFLWFQFGDAATRSWTGDILRLESTTLPTVGTNGEIRLDTSDNKLKKYNSTDVAWQEIAGGAGGLFAGGQNLLDNNSWESNTNNWTASGGTYTRNTGAANLIPPGVGSGSFDSSSASQTLTSENTTVTANDGLASRNGAASCSYKCASGTCTHLIEAYDGTNVLASTTITSSTTGFVRTSVNFSIPSSGTISLRTKSVASNEPTLYIDDCYLGLAEGFNLAQVSQAEFVTSAYYAPTANCTWPTAASGTFAEVTADTDCPGITTQFSSVAITTTDVDLPRLVYASLPAGKYLITADVSISQSGAGYTEPCISVGGVCSMDVTYDQVPANQQHLVHMELYLDNTTAQARTFSIMVAGQSSPTISLHADSADGSKVYWKVFKYPSAQETLYKPDELNWLVDVSIGGGNFDLGTSDIATAAEIINGSMDMVNNSNGTVTGYIPCSTTNASSGATCSAGSESLGVAVSNIPRAGKVEVCAQFTHETDVGDAAATGYQAVGFSIVKTGNADQTVEATGPNRNHVINQMVNGVGRRIVGFPVHLCSFFNVTSAGKHTFRIFYEQDVTATVGSSNIIADRSASVNLRDVHLTVRPIDVVSPPVVISNSVINSSVGPTRVEVANLNCDAGSAITSQNGAWIDSIGNISAGACALVLTTGIFSATPYCTCSSINHANPDFVLGCSASSSTAVTIDCDSNAGVDCTSYDFILNCVGAD